MKSSNTKRPVFSIVVCLIAVGFLSSTASAENRIDTQRPDAPELAAYGKFKVGVTTLNLINPDQIDIISIVADGPTPDKIPYYDRPLTLEIWYPALNDSKGSHVLNAYLRDAKQQVELHGQAIRDAKPLVDEQQYPLVLISHGYPGNRYLMAHLGENLASKGYVVVAIDHTDSTYRTQAAFGSTLVNRPLDQTFVLDQIQSLNKDKTSFLHNMVNTQNSALIGYSMGAYGAVIMAGAGVTESAVLFPRGAPHRLLSIHQHGSDTQKTRPDPRLKTVIAFAPWGMNYGVWDKQSLADIAIPMLFIAGSVDDISGYKNGGRAIWENAKNVDRALLTFDNANHNAGAAMAPPKETFYFDKDLGVNISEHYIDAVWDNVRMNNISQHFATAWLDRQLKGKVEMDAYLDLIPNANEGVWSMGADNIPTPEHTHWQGFKNRTAKGLRLEWLKK